MQKCTKCLCAFAIEVYSDDNAKKEKKKSYGHSQIEKQTDQLLIKLDVGYVNSAV